MEKSSIFTQMNHPNNSVESVLGVQHDPWDLKHATEFVRFLQEETRPIGWCVALTGSVLFKGSSLKDLDIVIFPYSTDKADENALRQLLQSLGLKMILSQDGVHKIWREMGSTDEKNVSIWTFESHGVNEGTRRIDLFILK